ncbi:MAG: C39 family peptidase [Oscillospiraceae bacterium]|nr:C39 family peptidase [Oscillospiraceae bacterium]
MKKTKVLKAISSLLVLCCMIATGSGCQPEDTESDHGTAEILHNTVTESTAATTTKSDKAVTTEYTIPTTRPSRLVSVPAGTYYIDVENILQRPELPTGCEATSLTIMLNFLGYNVDKRTIVDEYLPKTTRMYSLNTHFIGNPYSKSGLGCYAPVIVATANRYFDSVNSNDRAENISGASAKELYNYVANGKPVICWVTIALTDTYISNTWIAKDTGETINFYINEHCTVLVGYNSHKGTVTLNDPWKGIVTYPMSLFEKRYMQLGSQAILISQ